MELPLKENLGYFQKLVFIEIAKQKTKQRKK
jgi:hypothetical protein